MTQPFRAGDVVEMLVGRCKGEHWVVACYDEAQDEAWIAGWPETIVDEATKKLRLHRAATDAQHADMIAMVERSDGLKRGALEGIRERGGTP